MQVPIKHLFFFIFLLFGFSFFVSCQTESIVIENNSNYENAVAFKRITKEQFDKKNETLFKKFENKNVGISSKKLIGNSLKINTNQIIEIASNATANYTFEVESQATTPYLQNLVLSIEENGNMSAKILTYNLSDYEKYLLREGTFIDVSDKIVSVLGVKNTEDVISRVYKNVTEVLVEFEGSCYDVETTYEECCSGKHTTFTELSSKKCTCSNPPTGIFITIQEVSCDGTRGGADSGNDGGNNGVSAEIGFSNSSNGNIVTFPNTDGEFVLVCNNPSDRNGDCKLDKYEELAGWLDLNNEEFDFLQAHEDITDAFTRYLNQNNTMQTRQFARELFDLVKIEEVIDSNAINFVLQAETQNKFYEELDETFLESVNQYVYLDTTDPIITQQLTTYFTVKCAALRNKHPNWSNIRIYWEATKNLIHIGLDIFGLVPFIGELADLTNGVLYTIEGDGVNATLSYASAVPVAGWAAFGVKYAVKVTNVPQTVYTIATKVKLTWKVLPNGTIYFGANSTCRAQLRKVLGLAVGDARQAHHIIPLELQTNPVVQKAAKSSSAFHINEALNGMPLPSTNHLIGHATYNTKVGQILTDLNQANPNMSTGQAYNHIIAINNQVRNHIINNPNYNLGQIVNLIQYP